MAAAGAVGTLRPTECSGALAFAACGAPQPGISHPGKVGGV
jgi:hypothetical protein